MSQPPSETPSHPAEEQVPLVAPQPAHGSTFGGENVAHVQGLPSYSKDELPDKPGSGVNGGAYGSVGGSGTGVGAKEGITILLFGTEDGHFYIIL
jgi:hypothetical protein